MISVFAWLGLALAQSTPAAPPRDVALDEPPAESAPVDDAPEDDVPVGYEIDVYGQQRIIAARQQVMNELREAGYDREIDKGDAIVMRHSKPWRGDVYLYRDGWVKVKRQPVRVEAPPAGAFWCVFVYPCVRIGGQIVSRSRMQVYKHEAAEVFNDGAEAWASTIADVATDERLRGLPDDLERLWRDGVPLDPNERTLVTYDERKAALLSFWQSRTESSWGESVRGAVEAFMRAVVQDSDHPFTDEDLARFNASTTAARPLVLRRVAAPVVQDGAADEPRDP